MDWVGNIDDRKHTSGEALFSSNSLVSWLSKKQPLVSLSMAKVENKAITSCCTQVPWMKQTLRYTKIEYDHAISILCDNTSAIDILNNPIMH